MGMHRRSEVTQYEDTYFTMISKINISVFLTGLAEDPYLRASDGGVVLVSEDPDGDTFAMQR